MGLRITIDIFSGRPDPFWNIEDNDQVRLLQLAARNRAALAEPTSGYTGLAGPVTVLPLPAGRSRLVPNSRWPPPPRQIPWPPLFSSIVRHRSDLMAATVQVRMSLDMPLPALYV